MNCQYNHQPPIEHRVEEVNGPRASLKLQNIYDATYPDGCPADRSCRYGLYVDGIYLLSWVKDSERTPAILKTMIDIANKMNES